MGVAEETAKIASATAAAVRRIEVAWYSIHAIYTFEVPFSG
jgi:hypothetical protein